MNELLDQLGPIERYWAYPGPLAYQQGRRLFAAGKYTRFARAVASLNRGLVTDSYRNGQVWSVAAAIQEPLDRDSQAPAEMHNQRPYFEVLVVEDMTESQERALRDELRKWRRPDDEFIYEIVVVPSYEDALIAARINFNIQACVIKRRFAHHSGRDLSALEHFVDDSSPEDLMEQPADTRAEMLGQAIAAIRPELDLYMMTEISLEDVAGWLSHHFRRIFHSREGTLELHLSLLAGVGERYEAPFFAALKQYSHRPTGVFHALPISQGKSIVNSHWIKDMIGFYGLDIFLAETSATCGGLDSLLEPTGPLRDAQDLASETFGSRQTYFATNGTSTANKIVSQALVQPGDIVLVDRNCHQSHHYGLMLSGAHVIYLDAYPLNEFSMYGAVPLRSIKAQLLALRRAGKLDRVKMLMLTNCTFDGMVYDAERVMQECLAIKPDLVFLWDEAWFAFARFHPIYRPRTAMHSANSLLQKLRSPEYRQLYETWISEQPDSVGRGNARHPADPRSGQGQGAGLRDPVDAQDADLAASGIDDPRVRPGLRAEGGGELPRGLHGAHLDVAQLSDPGLARPRPPAGGAGGFRAGAEAGRVFDATARRRRQPPAAPQVHALPDHHRPHPGGVPSVGHRPAAAVRPEEHADRVGQRRVRARPLPGDDLHRRDRASTATPSSGST